MYELESILLSLFITYIVLNIERVAYHKYFYWILF